jgi:hypothetical protein
MPQQPIPACCVATHKEEIYNSLHHYVSIPQDVKLKRMDYSTNKEVCSHYTTYDYGR